jgi:hypothetical protein
LIAIGPSAGKMTGHLGYSVQGGRALLMPLALGLALFQIADAGERAGGNRGGGDLVKLKPALPE